jgi:hypothetical protein
LAVAVHEGAGRRTAGTASGVVAPRVLPRARLLRFRRTKAGQTPVARGSLRPPIDLPNPLSSLWIRRVLVPAQEGQFRKSRPRFPSVRRGFLPYEWGAVGSAVSDTLIPCQSRGACVARSSQPASSSGPPADNIRAAWPSPSSHLPQRHGVVASPFALWPTFVGTHATNLPPTSEDWLPLRALKPRVEHFALDRTVGTSHRREYQTANRGQLSLKRA